MMKKLGINAVFAAILTATWTFHLHAGEKDIVDTAVGAGSFKTLAAALQAADLVDALKGKGPFTVFRTDRRSHCQTASRHRWEAPKA